MLEISNQELVEKINKTGSLLEVKNNELLTLLKQIESLGALYMKLTQELQNTQDIGS